MKLATLCYLRKNGQTLMLHRIKKENDMHAGKWNGLGGKLEPGETPEECAIREIQEESGLRAGNLTMKGLLTFPAFAAEEDWYTFVFLVEAFEGELINSAEGELRWIDNNKLLDLELWEGDRIFLDWLERPEFFSGKFVYEQGRFVDYEVVFYS
ncbi:MAG: 8-oxo-dGTP diphosphatase [Anaerolineales bacterium]